MLKIQVFRKKILFLFFVSVLVPSATSFAREETPATTAHSLKAYCENIYDAPGHGISFYELNPTYRDLRDDSGSWIFSTPEERGLDTDALLKGVGQLKETRRALSVLVVKDGAIVLEEYFNGSSKHDSNNIHSASKSMMSALIGIAIKQGYIEGVDQQISELLPEYFSSKDSKRKRALTVRHLLTMSSGMKWRDDPVSGTEYDIQKKEDWVHEILSLPFISKPGKKFFYNTGLTHLMSAIISENTGTSACEFAHRNLFGPIGITAEHWGRDPQGYYSGGYNLYMTPREMAKFGLLILQGGRTPQGQVIPRDWIKQSVSTHFRPYDDYGYGYNWWITRINGQVIPYAWGWGGQMIYVLPKLGAVVVITRDTSDADLVAEEPENHDFVRKFVRMRQ